MEEILVLNDDSHEARHAATYSYNLACQYNKNILVANLFKVRRQLSKMKSFTGFQESAEADRPEEFFSQLNKLEACNAHVPGIRRLDVSGFSAQDLARYVYDQKIWMVVQGSQPSLIDLQSVLNRLNCPILLVPTGSALRVPERIAYLADLRYAQVPVINFLSRLYSGRESVIMTHICAKGLPELDRDYAMDLFSDGLNKNVNCDHLFLSRLVEKSFLACIDQILNGIQADLLVCSNHHYHFDQLLGGNISNIVTGELNVPVLVFPH